MSEILWLISLEKWISTFLNEGQEGKTGPIQGKVSVGWGRVKEESEVKESECDPCIMFMCMKLKQHNLLK
jgi:hypothetical protein